MHKLLTIASILIIYCFPANAQKIVNIDKKIVDVIIEPEVVYNLKLKTNHSTALFFPVDVEDIILGNSKLLAAEKKDNKVFIKPATNTPFSSNLHVSLSDGKLISFKISASSGNKDIHKVFFKLSYDAEQNIRFERYKESVRIEYNQKLEEQKDILFRELPDTVASNCHIYRINQSRSATTAKYKGAWIHLSGVMIYKSYMYWLFETSAPENTNCPTSFVKKITVKPGKSKMSLDFKEIKNSGKYIVLKSAAITAKDKKGKIKVYATVNIYSKEFVIKTKLS